MFRVKNKKLVRKLAVKNLSKSRVRNIIVISAISLVSVLFTSIFLLVFSLNEYSQQQLFRQVGGYAHASVKNITESQAEELKNDESIKRAGLRYFLGTVPDAPFNKYRVEVSYMDDSAADITFSVPVKGNLPRDNGDGLPQLATNTHILQLLGIKPEIGAKIPFTFKLDNGDKITDIFSLSGWWDYDDAIQADMVLVTRQYCNKVLKDYKTDNNYENTGKWDLEIFFDNSFDIEGKLNKLLNKYNYQPEDAGKDNYISAGINWGYSSTQILNNLAITDIAGFVLALIIVIFTGYLVVYNIFRISVSNDINFYGMLKTIGTTKRQIRKIVFIQAMVLLAAGIPAGMLIGSATGNILVSVVKKGMENYDKMTMAISPVPFVISIVFTIVTVFLSCFKPSRMAAKVSPVEAASYTEAQPVTKKKYRKTHGAGIVHMAFANVGRNKVKTGLVVTSFVLSTLILDLTISMASGFDMDKFTSRFYTTDFIIGRADYLNPSQIYNGESIGNSIIEEINKQEGISETGYIYGTLETVSGWLAKEQIESFYDSMGFPRDEEYNEYLFSEERNGKYRSDIQLYGMEQLALNQLEVLEGDVDKVNEEDSNYIIDVVMGDDYSNPVEGTDIHEMGSKITLTYGDKYFYYDKKTGKEIDENTPDNRIGVKELEQKEMTYTICAKVIIPDTISYRFYNGKQYILGSEAFVKDTGINNVMSYLVNIDDGKEEQFEKFLEYYTTNIDSALDYESKISYQKNFGSYRDMFVNVGSAAAFIIGLIGMLNFFNTIFTGINSRKREFAVMQAVGMTGVQLKRMLICEGMIYTCMAVVISFIVCAISEPVLMDVLSGVYWFFTSKWTLFPVLVLAPVYAIIGAAVPLVLYPSVAKKSVVDRLKV